MKKLLLVTLLLALAFTGAQAQYQGLTQSFNVVGNAVAAGAQAGMPVAGNQAGLYQLTFVASGTVSTCTVQIQDSSDNVSYTNRGAAQTCTSTGTFSFQATPTSWVRLNVTAQTGTGNVTYTLVAVPNTPVAISAPSGGTLTLPTIAGGLTASGSVANDFSGSTGAFKTSTGAVTIGGATTITSAAPQLDIGVAGSSLGQMTFENLTSGKITVQAPSGALGTPVLTLPALTGSIGTGYTCGASLAAGGACANTALAGTFHMVFGSALLSSNTSAITGFSPAFTSSTSWWCVANDVTTRANPVQMIPSSGSAATITNTTGASDLIQFACFGN